MNTLNYCLLIASSVLVLFIIDRATASPNKCVFKCLKGVIKCKREVNVGFLPPGTDCCSLYAECYMGCIPDATSVPPCKQKGKRGSWNKRTPVYMLPGRSEPEPQSEYPMNSSPERKLYSSDALNYLFAPTASDDLD